MWKANPPRTVAAAAAANKSLKSVWSRSHPTQSITTHFRRCNPGQSFDATRTTTEQAQAASTSPPSHHHCTIISPGTYPSVGREMLPGHPRTGQGLRLAAALVLRDDWLCMFHRQTHKQTRTQSTTQTIGETAQSKARPLAVGLRPSVYCQPSLPVCIAAARSDRFACLRATVHPIRSQRCAH